MQVEITLKQNKLQKDSFEQWSMILTRNCWLEFQTHLMLNGFLEQETLPSFILGTELNVISISRVSCFTIKQSLIIVKTKLSRDHKESIDLLVKVFVKTIPNMHQLINSFTVREKVLPLCLSSVRASARPSQSGDGPEGTRLSENIHSLYIYKQHALLQYRQQDLCSHNEKAPAHL